MRPSPRYTSSRPLTASGSPSSSAARKHRSAWPQRPPQPPSGGAEGDAALRLAHRLQGRLQLRSRQAQPLRLSRRVYQSPHRLGLAQHHRAVQQVRSLKAGQDLPQRTAPLGGPLQEVRSVGGKGGGGAALLGLFVGQAEGLAQPPAVPLLVLLTGVAQAVQVPGDGDVLPGIGGEYAVDVLSLGGLPLQRHRQPGSPGGAVIQHAARLPQQIAPDPPDAQAAQRHHPQLAAAQPLELPEQRQAHGDQDKIQHNPLQRGGLLLQLRLVGGQLVPRTPPGRCPPPETPDGSFQSACCRLVRSVPSALRRFAVCLFVPCQSLLFGTLYHAFPLDSSDFPFLCTIRWDANRLPSAGREPVPVRRASSPPDSR